MPLDFSLFLSPIGEVFGLETLREARAVAGGLQHRLLRVEGDGRSFALKILSRRAVITAEQRAGLERAENVAELAARAAIPALCARRGRDGRFLQLIGDEWVALFPWQEGDTLSPDAASEAQCALMGNHLGALHALRIRFPDQSAPTPEAFVEGHFAELLSRGERENAAWTDAVRDKLAELESVNRSAMRAQVALRENWVTGHLDFDQKNVLWQNGAPIILDWEGAKPIHPALELLGAGLNWAGQSTGTVQRASFEAFARGYLKSNSVTREEMLTACVAVVGKWLIWLEFNLQRSLESAIRGTPEAEVCDGAISHALPIALQLHRDVPRYQAWCEGLF